MNSTRGSTGRVIIAQYSASQSESDNAKDARVHGLTPNWSAVKRRQKSDLDRARVVEKPDDVGVRRRGFGRGLVCNLSQPPEEPSRALYQRWAPAGTMEKLKTAEPKRTRDEAVSEGDKDFAPEP